MIGDHTKGGKKKTWRMQKLPPAEVERVRAVYLETGSARAVSRATGHTIKTCRKYINDEEFQTIVRVTREEKTQSLARRVYDDRHEEAAKLAKDYRIIRDLGVQAIAELFNRAMEVNDNGEVVQVKDADMLLEFTKVLKFKDIKEAEREAQMLLDPHAMTGPEVRDLGRKFKKIVMKYVPQDRQFDCAQDIVEMIEEMERSKTKAMRKD